MKKILKIITALNAFLLFTEVTSAYTKGKDYISYTTLNIVVILLTLTTIVYSYIKQERKPQEEIVNIYSEEQKIMIQRENYEKCPKCNTQNSMNRENCYNCNERF